MTTALTQYANRAKVFQYRSDARHASVRASGMMEGLIEAVEDGFLAVVQSFGDEDESVDLYVV